VKHMLKDIVIATRLARGFGIEFGATDASRHGLTEEMRQGRGDSDYSSLFRQYFPAGGPIGAPANGEEDQPRLAGIDEANTGEPEKVPVAVETSAEVPSEAKAMGEVVQASAQAEPAVANEASVHTDVATAPPEPRPAVPEMPAAKEPVAAAEAAPKEDTILKFPAPMKEDEGEEPRGLWGGFWRRRTDD